VHADQSSYSCIIVSVTPAELAQTLLRRAAKRRIEDERAGEDCLRAVRGVVATLRSSLGFDRVWIIGSLAWGRFGVRSDVDVVIEGGSPEALVTAADEIGAATGRSVDVLALDQLPPAFRRRVLLEGQSVP
jgi:predicted nucleotidyltransferase